MAEGIDYAWHPAITPDRARAIKASGHGDFVMRYLSHDSSKNLSNSERAALHGAGIDVGLNWEYRAGAPEGGRSQGLSDAKEALRQANALDAPKSAAIYFSVDYDTTVGPNVTAYFKAVAEVIGLNRTGAYGGIRVISALFDKKLITYGWQTYAWSSGRRDERAHVYQYHNNVTVAGISADLNRTYHDAGLWKASGGGGSELTAAQRERRRYYDNPNDLSVLTAGERRAVEAHRRAVKQQSKVKIALWYARLSLFMERLRALGVLKQDWEAPRHRYARYLILRTERGNTTPPPPKPPPPERDIGKEHPELKAGVRDAVQKIVNQFPDIKISSTTGGNHVAGSYHFQGRAVDLAYYYVGDPSDENRKMDEVGAWIDKNLPSLTEGIHNSTLSVKNGKRVPASFWGSSIWSGHRNHIHVAV